MIKKERLEELIEQGATVCNAYKDWDNVWHCRFGNVVQEENHLLFKENGSSLSVIMHNTNNLYETKEQAEWEWEFSCIERTERLELPTWEDLKNCLNRFCYFTDCCGREYCLSYIRATNKLRLRYFIDELDEEECGVWELTKENYTLACRKCKELFLGGSNGDIR